MCRVNMFCCGCSLTAGAITAAVLQALEILGTLSISIRVLVVASWLASDNPNGDSSIFINVFTGLKSDNEENSIPYTNYDKPSINQQWMEMREQRLAVAYWMRVFGYIGLTIAIISFIIMTCLIIGTCKRKACLILPWLIGVMISIVLQGLLCLFLLLFTFVSLTFLAPLSLTIYMWIVVYNYYLQLKEAPPVYEQSMTYKA